MNTLTLLEKNLKDLQEALEKAYVGDEDACIIIRCNRIELVADNSILVSTDISAIELVQELGIEVADFSAKKPVLPEPQHEKRKKGRAS